MKEEGKDYSAKGMTRKGEEEGIMREIKLLLGMKKIYMEKEGRIGMKESIIRG